MWQPVRILVVVTILGCGLLLAVVGGIGCGDDTSERDSGPAPGRDSGATTDAVVQRDTGAATDTGSTADAGGQCQTQGERCGTGFPDCCHGLMCCIGVPVPEGQEYCGNDCPISDRKLKYDKRSLAPEAVLERLSTLPIASWSYNHEPPGVRHIGPMAQDFYATFGLGSSDEYIAQLDADGVALVAIQALYKELQQLRCEVKGLKAENAALRASLNKR